MPPLLQIFLTTGDLKNQEDCARIVHDSVEHFNGQLDVLVSYEELDARYQGPGKVITPHSNCGM